MVDNMTPDEANLVVDELQSKFTAMAKIKKAEIKLAKDQQKNTEKRGKIENKGLNQQIAETQVDGSQLPIIN